MIIDALHLATLPLDGTDMLVSSDGSAIQVWDPRTGKRLSTTRERAGKLNELIVCPTGWRDPLITVTTDEGLFWFEPRTGALGNLPDRSAQVFPMAAWAGTLLAGSGSAPYPLLRWDAGTGARLEPLGRHGDQVTAIAVLTPPGGDGPVVCAGDKNGKISRWNPRTGAPAGERLDAGGDEVIGAITPVELPDGRVLIAAATADLYRWDAVTGEPIGAPIVVDSYAVATLEAVTVNGRPELITVGYDRAVQRWDAETGERVGEPAPGRCATVLRRHGLLTLAIGTLDGRIELLPLDQTHPDRRI
ncbi:WD40 repeat domain-containing protein [Actinoplanes sp. NPDC020271]|uniref:WD40 repeat domain-containing protein n=1 Tax=Actinoplanes sp. NPDC020271 TaxID=3363896 RepID=UPI00378C500A